MQDHISYQRVATPSGRRVKGQRLMAIQPAFGAVSRGALSKQLSLIGCLLFAASVLAGPDNGPPHWYTHAFEGTALPNEAPGLQITYRGDTPPAESMSRDGVYTMRTTSEPGVKHWSIDMPDWRPSPGTGTLELRVRVGPGAGAGAGRGSARVSVCNDNNNWTMYLNPDHIRCRTPQYGADPIIRMAPGAFHTIRLVIRGNGLAIHLDGDPEPVLTGWKGFGAPTTFIRFGDTTNQAEHEWGTVEWDHIRWNNAYSIDPAQEMAAREAGAAIASADTPAPRLLVWKGQRLVRQGKSPFPRFDGIVALINEKDFDRAFEAIEALPHGPGTGYARAAVAAALAGHPDNYLDERCIRLAYVALVEDWSFGGIPARRLLHELHLFRFAPGHGMHTNPILLTTRNMVRDHGIREAREYYMGHARAHTHWYDLGVAWSLLRAFADQEPAYAVLREDCMKLLENAVEHGRLNGEGGGSARLLRLIDHADKYPWAATAIPEDSPLYPKRLFSWMKKYYWWWIQMGRERPMAEWGYREFIEQLNALFPDSERVQVYQGKPVAWGDKQLSMSPSPEDAPGWAVNLRELRARCDYVIQWWFDHRQAANGALGGGWEDDCETLRVWATSPIICDNEALKPGIRKLVNGIWRQGGVAEHGYDPQMKDVEHSSEMTADSSVIMLIDYGDPLQFERFLKTTRTARDVHTAVNERGHLHFRSISMSATATRDGGCDTHYHGRAMRPVALVAWYSGLPQAKKLLHQWSRAWSEDAARQGKTKPAGVMPAIVDFETDTFDGKNDWTAQEYGSLYRWDPGQQDMLVGKMLGAWALTGDDRVLDGLRAELELMREHMGKGENQAEWVWSDEKMRFDIRSPENAEPITAEPVTRAWAGQHLSRYPHYGTWYRTTTGARQFDDILATDREYGRYLVTGDPAVMEQTLGTYLEGMCYRLPMMTYELSGTDRVSAFGLNYTPIISAMTGSSVPITQPPMFHVTWAQVNHDFAALVRNDFWTNGGTIWAYQFGHRAARPEIRFWRLEPGKYDLRVTIDTDQDGKPDAVALEIVPFEYVRRLDSVRFDLPPQKNCLLTVVQTERLAPLPERMADVAITARDLVLSSDPVRGRKCRGELTVHNIGSADAQEVEIRITALAEGEERTKAFVSETLATLPFPADLEAKTATIPFTWFPAASGPVRLQAEVSCGDGAPEIYLGNNVAWINVTVR